MPRAYRERADAENQSKRGKGIPQICERSVKYKKSKRGGTPMDGGTRSNQGYEIIEGCTIGNTELVIGHHPKAPNPYVCWYCKGGDNYYWGCYCNTLEAAREKLNERYQSECQMPYNQQPDKKARQHDDRER